MTRHVVGGGRPPQPDRGEDRWVYLAGSLTDVAYSEELGIWSSQLLSCVPEGSAFGAIREGR
jgi:hypothetical protein